MFLFALMNNIIKKIMKSFGILIIIVFTIIFLSACKIESNEPVAVAFVVGNHANSKELPIMADEVTMHLNKATETFGSVTIIVADGEPYCVTNLQINEPEKEGLSDKKLRQISKDLSLQIQHMLSEAQAVTPEVDTLGAIRLASRALKEEKSAEKHIVVIDTGLSTTGSLDFRNNIIESDAEVLRKRLAEIDAIPDLSGVSISWIGLGDTALPQADLSPRQYKNLEQIWEAILTGAGAESVYFYSTIPGKPALAEKLPEVSVVSLFIEPDIVDISEPIVFSEERVAFMGDSSEFIDKKKVIELLRPIADYMINHPKAQIMIIGTTATTSDYKYCLRLSQERADAVYYSFIELGVQQSQLQTLGMGFKDPWHLPDLNTDGTQNANAKMNRKVVLLDRNSSVAHEILMGDLPD